uniref:Putative secreted protein n=1 Tax=Anopheles triannulatus TaxID=58253 RepID=A0A2M4B7R4_9DIPT
MLLLLLITLQASHATHIASRRTRSSSFQTSRTYAMADARIQIRLITATVLASERIGTHRLCSTAATTATNSTAVLHAHLTRPFQ